MLKIKVTQNEAGQRLDKLLAKRLSLAPKSFFYKMLRKKNIKLNGRRAGGSEKLQIGDEVTLFLSEETIAKFSEAKEQEGRPDWKRAMEKKVRLDIIYEDTHVLLLDKPAGMLSQKAKPQDLSLNEYMTAYLFQSGALTEEEYLHFHPSICNRLDRNTSGLVAAGKTLPALQELSEMFRARSMAKYYLTVVKGRVLEEQDIKGYLWKDEAVNRVTVWKELPRDRAVGDGQEPQPIETKYRPLAVGDGCTLLEVHLITGRTHQIRAHLASMGYPVAGDGKYGDMRFNDKLRKRYGIQAQVLHAWRMEFPDCPGVLAGLSGRTFSAPVPAGIYRICEGENLAWEHGTAED